MPIAQLTPPLRQAVTFMRWADREGVESYQRDVIWLREIRARAVRHAGMQQAGMQQAELLDGFVDSDGSLHAIFQATQVAARIARIQASQERLAAGVVAEAWDVPLIDVDGRRTAIPEDWFLDEEAARGAWLIAAAQGRRTVSPATRLLPRLTLASEVWNSARSIRLNQLALEEFIAGAGDTHGKAEDGQPH